MTLLLQLRTYTVIASLNVAVAGLARAEDKPGAVPAPAAAAHPPGEAPAKKPPPPVKGKKAPPKKGAKPPPPPKKDDEDKDEPTPAADAGGRGTTGIALKFGTASFSGDFSEDKGQSMYGLMALLYPTEGSRARPKAQWTHDFLLGFELRTMVDLEFSSAKQSGTYAVGGADKKVGVTMLSVNGLGCFLTDIPVQVCPYIGLGTMEFQENGNNDSTAGVYPYGLVVPFKLDNLFSDFGLLAGAQMNFYGVSSKAAGKTFTIDEGTISAFAGLTF